MLKKNRDMVDLKIQKIQISGKIRKVKYSEKLKKKSKKWLSKKFQR